MTITVEERLRRKEVIALAQEELAEHIKFCEVCRYASSAEYCEVRAAIREMIGQIRLGR